MKDLSKRTAVLVRFGYDGAGFYGLQPQPGVRTAGAALEERLRAAAGARPKGLAFAARTDRGVHAEKNLATCYFLADKGAPAAERNRVVDVDAVARAAAVDRDDGLRDVVVCAVDPRVHARGISRGKHYRYVLRGGVDPEPEQPGPHEAERPDGGPADADGGPFRFTDPHRWSVAPPLDLARMQAAAAQLRGTFDFSSFRAGGCSAASPIKTLYRFDVTADGADVVVDLVGDAFVRKMVRNLIGLLAEVGTGWRPVDDVARVVAARHRQAAGITAPPQGLTLMAVGSAWPPDGSWLLPDCPKDHVVDDGD